MNTPDSDLPMAVHAAREGDGYWKSKGDQWQLLCPHMSSTAKIALGILCSLTGQTHPVRKLTAAEFAGLLSKGPVAPGGDPKGMSPGGAIRVLRELAELGQLTRPDGARLTISSRPSAELSICVWKRPRHDCGCARNVHDALQALRGEPQWFPPARAGENSDQPSKPGENSDQPGENSDQAGQNSAKTQPLTCDDEPPLSLPSPLPSLSGEAAGEAAAADGAGVVTGERESGAARGNDEQAPRLPAQSAAEVETVEDGRLRDAAAFLADLPGRLGRSTVRSLAPLVVDSFADGYTPETLRAELARRVDVSRIKHAGALPGLYRKHLQDLPPAQAKAGGPERCPDHPSRYRKGCLDCAMAVPA
jgi:hypothetical protein